MRRGLCGLGSRGMSGCTFPSPPAVIFLAPWEPVATLAVHGTTPLLQGKGQGALTPGDAMWKVIASDECSGHCLWLHCRSPAVRAHGTRLSLCLLELVFQRAIRLLRETCFPQRPGPKCCCNRPSASACGTTWASACAAAPFRLRGAALRSQMSSWHRQKCSQTPC